MSDIQSPALRTIAAFFLSAQLLLVLGGWLFRATLYWTIPVAPGEPYGLGDVLEWLIGITLVGTSVIAIGLAALFAAIRRLRDWRAVAMLGLSGALAFPITILVHPHVPQLVHRSTPAGDAQR